MPGEANAGDWCKTKLQAARALSVSRKNRYYMSRLRDQPLGFVRGNPLQPRNGMTSELTSARSSRLGAAGFRAPAGAPRASAAVVTFAATAALMALAVSPPAAAKQA